MKKSFINFSFFVVLFLDLEEAEILFQAENSSSIEILDTVNVQRIDGTPTSSTSSLRVFTMRDDGKLEAIDTYTDVHKILEQSQLLPYESIFLSKYQLL